MNCNKFSGYKGDKLLLPYISPMNKWKLNKNETSFMLAASKMKYLDINLRKYVQC